MRSPGGTPHDTVVPRVTHSADSTPETPRVTRLNAVEIRVLGPIEVEDAGRVLDLGARKQRTLLSVLALHRGRATPTSAIVDALWGERPPASHAVTLQGYVSDLRKVLEPGRAPRGAASVLVTSSVGYALKLPAESFDDHRLDVAVHALARAFPTSAERPWEPSAPADPSELRALSSEVDAALDQWRGDPYADLPDEVVVAERARLRETHVAARELREAVRLHLGDAAEAARRLEPLALEHPHRERLWLLHAVALVRAGRQVDGLAALRRHRDGLREDLGIDPGAAVAALETSILQGRLADTPPAPSASAIRVALVDDHPVFRMGMAGLLGSLDGIEVAAVAGDAPTARAVVDDSVHVVLMDLDLGAESGIDLTAELTARHEDLHVLVMTMHDDDAHVGAALRAGASGYLVKSADPEAVHRAVRAVARGEFIVAADAARAARGRLFAAPPGTA